MAEIAIMLPLFPFANPLLLPDTLDLPLSFLGQTLLLQAGGALGCGSRVDGSGRLPQPLGQAPGADRLATLAKLWFAALLPGLMGRPQARRQFLRRTLV